jgi:protein involved in polysaccharide export with SLBB domain
MTRSVVGRAFLAAALSGAPLVGGSAQDPNGTTAAQRAAATRIEPGDLLVLKVWREPLLSDSTTVNERGEVALPRLGVMRITEYSISAFQDTLRARYATFLRNPAITVAILRRIVVNGEVARPDVYLVDVTTTLRDVIARAGGIKETGNSKKVSIVRDGRTIRVPNWDRDRTLASDLRSGDQIVVGRKNWLALNTMPALSMVSIVASIALALRR